MSFTAKEKFFDRSHSFTLGDQLVSYRTVLPYKAKTWMALDMADAG